MKLNSILSENPCPYCGKNEWVPWVYYGETCQLGNMAIVDIDIEAKYSINDIWVDECTSCGIMVCL
jgi:predicted RNA-binding Zn-ribbon protein involved in translation (DUF1610 family)